MNKPLRPDSSTEQPQPTDDDSADATTGQTQAVPKAPPSDDPEAQLTTNPRSKNT